MRAWELRKDGMLLGVLIEQAREEIVWVDCKFEATREFAPYWQLFAEEARLLIDAKDDDRQQQLALYQQEIKELGLKLVSFGRAKPVENFVLHIDNDRARLKMSE